MYFFTPLLTRVRQGWVVEPNPRLKGPFMPEFIQNAPEIALSTAIFAGMVIVLFMATKHNCHG
jgi:hypothetical protein